MIVGHPWIELIELVVFINEVPEPIRLRSNQILLILDFEPISFKINVETQGTARCIFVLLRFKLEIFEVQINYLFAI